MPYDREERAAVGFGSMIGGAAPCTNCETEPQRINDLFCSAECRAEFEGDDE